MEFAVLVFITLMVLTIYVWVIVAINHLKEIKQQNEVLCQFLRDMLEREYHND